MRRSALLLLLLLFMPHVAGAVNVPKLTAVSFDNALVDAADQGIEALVTGLIRQGNDVNSRGDFEVTPLMRASYRGHNDIVELLIQLGADVNARDLGGATALHLAARQGNVETVKQLLKYDAFVDVEDDEGWTPLMRAMLFGHTDIAQELIKFGADVDHRNAWGDNAFALANNLKNKNEAMLMLEAARTNQKDKQAEIAAKKSVKVPAVETLPEELPLNERPLALAQKPVTQAQVEAREELAQSPSPQELAQLAPAAGTESESQADPLPQPAEPVAESEKVIPTTSEHFNERQRVPLNFEDPASKIAPLKPLPTDTKPAEAAPTPAIENKPVEAPQKPESSDADKENSKLFTAGAPETIFELPVLPGQKEESKLDKPVDFAAIDVPWLDDKKSSPQKLSALAPAAGTDLTAPPELTQTDPAKAKISKTVEITSTAAETSEKMAAPAEEKVAEVKPAVQQEKETQNAPIEVAQNNLPSTLSPENAEAPKKKELPVTNFNTEPPLELAKPFTPPAQELAVSEDAKPVAEVKEAPKKDAAPASKPAEKPLTEVKELPVIEKPAVKSIEKPIEVITPTTPPEASQGTVEVSEAVQVPLTYVPSTNVVTETQPTVPQENMVQPAPYRPAYVFQPSAPLSTEQFWLEVGIFPSEEAAVSHFEAVMRSGNTPPLRMRLVKHGLQNTPFKSVAIRVGPFDKTQVSQSLCDVFRAGSRLSCRMVRDASSIPADTTRRSTSELNRAAIDSNYVVKGHSNYLEQQLVYWIQLGSYRSQENAVEKWKDLTAVHPELAKLARPDISRPKQGSHFGDIFRLRAGPFAQQADAMDICQGLRDQGVSCLVVRD